MVRRKPGRINLLYLELLVLVLHHQLLVSHSAGLRGEVWRSNLLLGYERSVELLVPPPDVAPLVCPFDAVSTRDTHCTGAGANQTTPVCHYNSETQEYTTLCWRGMASHSSYITLPTAHPKSYCGACHACFQDRDELQAAVDRYASYRQVDVELAAKYGWPIGEWCVDPVTSFSHLFSRKSKFNEDISRWDTSRVTDMTSTFQNAYAFNQPLGTWDVSRVTSMARMFAMAIHFDQDISSWDVSQCTDMGYMFLHALEFDQNISGWQVHNAFSLNSMFFGATKFQQEMLQTWQISEHADTENMCQWTQQTQEQEA